ncbi:NAD-dependent epimerase/dehydratase family protein [Flexithrix dorotheae]|uniref:NAD-dependent epimerase/dehydratase family protein n=1 Tax=Flexithrix dorotheae TaxID=70993 RepID=UPI0003649A03|nr:NAD-dependent epimerase/dehydratase family protein [Flexithrix dorotheae]
MEKILITGANGQLGTELTISLCKKYGVENIIASDINLPKSTLPCQFIKLDVAQKADLERVIANAQITQVFHLAALLSAKGESDPQFTWDLNMSSLITILEAARKYQINKIFWPSSIAVFGRTTPKENTPQHTVTEPDTMYGITKLAGERLCEYYFKKYGIDVRSLRYPGLISNKTLPGGGTTDYAVDIFYQAIETGTYNCFLNRETFLPMMYMPDAIKATIDLMDAPKENIKIRSSYNIGAVSFSPEDLAKVIQKSIPDFTITYSPDFRQQIADSWPSNIDDSAAKKDWGWQPNFDLDKLSSDMLKNLKEKLSNSIF